MRINGPANDGISFTNVGNEDDDGEQVTTEVALTNDGQSERTGDGQGQKSGGYKGNHFDINKVTCRRCSKKGHYTNECKGELQGRKSADQLLMAGIEEGEFDEQFAF
jgi:hypothetical protein